tara:strand:- start:155 stop:265 length:111 start_codon:yes stop_codon:yes gene_type:complete
MQIVWRGIVEIDSGIFQQTILYPVDIAPFYLAVPIH